MEWINRGGLLYANADLGMYEIAEVTNHTPETHQEWIVSFKHAGTRKLKILGECTSIENAKWIAESYDSYRATA